MRGTIIDHLKVIAKEVETFGCGNCGEFSALAFMYLYEQKVRPLDWVQLEGADHIFVIIGRKAGKINNYKSWGSEAVICDPWGQGFNKGNPLIGTYEGSDFVNKMKRLIPRFSGVEVVHREN